jgi:hypothetical protein
MSKTDKRNDRSDYVYLNGSVESMAANASAIDREAILKAGAALKRDEASLDQMFDLHTAALRFRGPYAIALGARDGCSVALLTRRMDRGAGSPRPGA